MTQTSLSADQQKELRTALWVLKTDRELRQRGGFMMSHGSVKRAIRTISELTVPAVLSR